MVENNNNHIDLFDKFSQVNNNLYNNSIDPIEIIETFEYLKFNTIIKISIFQYLVKNISDHDDLHDHFDDKNYFNIKHVNQNFLKNNLYNNSIDPIEIIETF